MQQYRHAESSTFSPIAHSRHAIAWLTLIAYIGQPLALMAQVVADQSATAQKRPVIDTTANGIPLVQIAAPNAGGLSHNQYTQYNVDPGGLILNNSSTTVLTQQAGYVSANPNMANGSARIILNEVTSTSASQLNGYTEVAGARAEVIIANPNGINCNGCGFINTSRGVLTTGTPVFGGSGSLDAFRVRGGEITIGASGLNASNTEQLDLISRSVKVNGQLWGNNLNVITGTNQVNYANLGVQLITGDANKPTVGIDVAQLGGMYANKIRLVGTEAGVGVNSLGTLAAQAGDINIDNQGLITLAGNTSASGNITINGAAGTTNSGTMYSQQAIQIIDQGDIANSGYLSAQGNLTLTGSNINSNGTLGAGIASNGTASRNGALTLTATNRIDATGQNLSSSNISLTAATLNLANSKTTAGNNMRFIATAGDIVFNGGIVNTTASISAHASGLIGNDSGIIVSSDLTFQSGSFSNRYGQIGATNASITTGLADNSGGKMIINQLDLSATDFINQSGYLSQTGTGIASLAISNTLDNSGGWIQSNSADFGLAPATLNNNHGQIVHAGQGTLTVNTAALSNDGGSISTQGQANISATSISNRGGALTAVKQATLNGALDNSAMPGGNGGYIGADSLIIIANNGAVNNSAGTIEANNGVGITAQSLNNAGGSIKNLGAAATLTIKAAQGITNTALNGTAGSIGSKGKLNISAGTLDNSAGKIYSHDALAVHTSGGLINSNGWLQTDGNLDLTAAALSNQNGNIEANGAASVFNLTATSIDNSGGRIANSGTGDTVIDGGAQIDNSAGTLGGTGNLNVHTTALKNNQIGTQKGLITSGNNLTLNVSNSLDNRNGIIYAFGNLNYDQAAATLNNTAGGFGSKGNTYINLASVNNQGGKIAANGKLGLTAATLGGAGNIFANGNADIKLLGDYTNAIGNVIKSNANLTFNTGGTFTNQTALEAAGNLTLTAGNITNQAGANINSAHTLLDSGTGDISNGGRIEGNTVETHSNRFTNTATVMGNAISIYANDLYNLESNAFIGATQVINLNITNSLNNIDSNALESQYILNPGLPRATIYSLGDINIGSTTTIGADSYITGRAKSVTNSSATIEAGNNLRISADQITNKRTVVGVEYGTETLGTPVTGSPSYTPSYANQQFTPSTTIAAQLLAGNGMWLSVATFTNDYSTIVAGQTLISNATTVANSGAAFQQRMTVTNGWQDSWAWAVTGGHDGWCDYHACWKLDYSYINTPIPYTPAPTYTLLGSAQYTYAVNPAVAITAVNTIPQATTGTSNPITSTTLVGTQNSASITGAGTPAPANNPNANTSITTGNTAGQPSITLPSSGLYTLHPQPGQQYLVVTDPRFASYQSFISSDYLVNRLVLDPAQIQKRLGDGFYEQKLVADQILQATGKRNLAGYSSTQAGYQALMDEALAAGKDLNLIPGVALTNEQIAALRRDIVWMVVEEVRLPDGSVTRALAPKVYFSQTSQMKLNPGGALIAANEINFKSGGVFDNSGTVISDVATNLIVGDLINRGSLQSGGVLYVNAANDISNLSGNIKGQDVTLVAGRDIRNERTATNTATTTALGLAAGISASNNLKMTAGRDLSIVAAEVKAGGNANLNAGNNITVGTLATQENSSGAYNAYINRVTNLGSKLDVGGNLSMQSGNDLQLTAANANVGGNMSLSAGGDINLLTVKDTLSSGYDSGVGQGKNYDETVIGTSLNAGGNINLQAGKAQAGEHSGDDDYHHRAGGGNINMLSASINSDNGNVNVLAAKNVNIGTTDEVHTAFSQTHSEESGFLSSKSTDTRTSSKQVNAIGSSISGDSITIQAGNAKTDKEGGSKDTGGNITVTGSSIAGTNDVILDAANNINIQAATSTSNTSSYSHTSENGLMSNGGWNITIGSREQTDKYDSANTLQSQNRSMVGSTAGSLTLKAGGKALISGSDIAAAQDINVAAKNITINSGLDESTNTQSHDTKQSGLTLALTSSVTDAGKTYEQMKQLGEQSKNPRIKALAIAAAALAAANAAQSPNVAVSATVGSSASHSDSTQTSTRTSGSILNAGGNLNLVATADKGEGAADKGGNITIQGSDIKAGHNLSLSADNSINLLADQNTASQISHNSSSSSGAGVAATYGKDGGAIGFTANAALARGNADGNDVSYTNTHLNAGNTLNLKSGGDTNLKGATANGKQIIADIGGNLNIESLQDTSTYDSKQSSVSGTATYFAGGSASVSGSQTSINGNYASVREQSGLKAGDNGFQINVKGNTDLKGAVIEASDQAVADNKNTFTTATLTTSEIQNRSEYDALSVNVSGGTGGVGAPLVLNAGDKDTSTTRSGISGAAITITDNKKQQELTGKDATTTVASLNRDVATGKDTSGAIANNLDVAEIQTSLTVTQTFVQQANTFVATQAQKADKLKAAGDAKQKQAAKETDPARQQQLQAEAKDLYQQSTASEADSAKWGPGGTYRQIATALTAAAGGNVTGGTGQLIQGAAVNYLQSLGAEQIKDLAKNIGGEGSPAHIALHGELACAGASAQGGDCGSAAMGASAGVVINTLLQGNPETMTATEKENRKNLVSTLVAGIAAGTGANSSGIVAATNAAVIETENNYLAHQQASRLSALKSQKALGKCDIHCEREMTQLQVLDAKNNQDLAACSGISSGSCDTTRQEVRSAAAEYIRKNNTPRNFDLANTYQDEKSETLALSGGTMDGQAIGTVQGAATTLAEGAIALGKLIMNVSGSAFGDTESAQNLRDGAGAAYDFVKDPNNWPQLLGAMSPQDREKLAVAYEQGDGKTVGQLMGAQMANMPINGGGALGTIRKIDKVAFEAEALAGSKLNHINGSIGEIRGYKNAVDDMGHVGIQPPGKVTAPGPDYITFDPVGDSIVVWDAKYRGPGGSFPSSLPTDKVKSWMPQINEAIQNMPSGPLRDKAMDAFNSGQVKGRISQWPTKR